MLLLSLVCIYTSSSILSQLSLMPSLYLWILHSLCPLRLSLWANSILASLRWFRPYISTPKPSFLSRLFTCISLHASLPLFRLYLWGLISFVLLCPYFFHTSATPSRLCPSALMSPVPARHYFVRAPVPSPHSISAAPFRQCPSATTSTIPLRPYFVRPLLPPFRSVSAPPLPPPNQAWHKNSQNFFPVHYPERTWSELICQRQLGKSGSLLIYGKVSTGKLERKCRTER